MSIVSLDDSFYGHPKVKRAGEEAADLFVRGLAYCRRYNTSGEIPKAALDELTKRRGAEQRADSLVRSGLWEDCGDHWQVHDYGVWYGADAEAKQERQRKLAASRARKYRERHGERDESRVTERDVTGVTERDENVTSRSRVPTRDASRVPERVRPEILTLIGVNPPNPPSGGIALTGVTQTPEPDPNQEPSGIRIVPNNSPLVGAESVRALKSKLTPSGTGEPNG